MKKKIIIIISLAVVIISAAVYKLFFTESTLEELVVKVNYGSFNVVVTSSGELQASKQIEIMGPVNARQARIWQMKISKLIPEGTIVKKGDNVAELDKSEILGQVKENQLELQKIESQFLQARLDTTLSLSSERDNLENLRYALEERKLQIELSAYEAPAVRRQAEIDYDRAERAYEQAKKNYQIKEKQAKAKLSVVGSDLAKKQQELDRLLGIMEEFNVLAPADGMLIYAREWSGRRITIGSNISSWNPVVATLPDLTEMESKTFINEVDIQKIKVGQTVYIGLDAAPKKKLTGKVTRVANIGEQRKGSDSKVFEVIIKINEMDTTLLPSMTTSNEVIVQTVDSVLFAPLECIHTEKIGDEDVSFVVKRDNGAKVKQEIQLGLISENEAIITEGVNRNDELFISLPPSAKDLKMIRLQKKESR